MKAIIQIAILAISLSASTAIFAEEEAAPEAVPAYDSPAKRTYETLKEAAAQLTDKIKGVDQKIQDDVNKTDTGN